MIEQIVSFDPVQVTIFGPETEGLSRAVCRIRSDNFGGRFIEFSPARHNGIICQFGV